MPLAAQLGELWGGLARQGRKVNTTFGKTRKGRNPATAVPKRDPHRSELQRRRTQSDPIRDHRNCETFRQAGALEPKRNPQVRHHPRSRYTVRGGVLGDYDIESKWKPWPGRAMYVRAPSTHS